MTRALSVLACCLIGATASAQTLANGSYIVGLDVSGAPYRLIGVTSATDGPEGQQNRVWLSPDGMGIYVGGKVKLRKPISIGPDEPTDSYGIHLTQTFVIGGAGATFDPRWTATPAINRSGYGAKVRVRFDAGVQMDNTWGVIVNSPRWGDGAGLSGNHVGIDIEPQTAPGARRIWGLRIQDNDAYINGLVDLTGANGGRVMFPVMSNPSSDPQTLDDYREGDFTPSVLIGGTDSGIDYWFRVGTFTKVGREVTASIAIAMSEKGASNGGVTIAGLPAPVSGTWSASIGAYGGLAGGGPLCGYSTGGTSLYLCLSGSTSSLTLQDSDLTDDFLIYLTIVYQTTQ